jgi:RNA polymerase subunit RPABC4/transcription elongation factor Spt4
MAVFNKCSNCGSTTISGQREGEHVFCSKHCRNWFYAPGYCEACATSTNSKSLGGTFTMNAVGTKLYGLACKGKECPVCHSIPQRMWFVVLFIPIFPVSREYRVKYTTASRYLSRQVNRAGAPATAVRTASVDASGGRKCAGCGTVFASDNKICPVCAGRAASATT